MYMYNYVLVSFHVFFQTALAHLESLAIDVEQAHPPASKESIDCLPQIIITEDHNGKDKFHIHRGFGQVTLYDLIV